MCLRFEIFLPQNAVILGCCDIIIATKGSNIGIGGPAMIEGGGLGVFHAKEIGPLSVHVPNGVVDIVAEDEAHAVKIAKQYLSYFQGRMPEWTAADQRVLRTSIPGLINCLAAIERTIGLKHERPPETHTAQQRFVSG